MSTTLVDLPTDDDRPENPELFISYASGDLDRATTLHARLIVDGRRVWFDKVRLTPGCNWHREIEAGCEAARVMLPLITPRWAKSEWTRYETYAHDAVIPVLAEGKAEDVLPPPLRRWNAVALDPLAADDAAWDSLVAAIRRKLAEPAPERAPRIVDLPYSANPFFIGRDDDLVRIHEELHAAPVAALTQGRVRALAAMGGIGKTTLANEYARRFWRLYPQILWVDARTGLESGFALLFDKLFPGRSDAGMQQPDKAAAALRELSGRTERLLVLDNVEDAESVRPWLVRDPTSGCRTLITSRFADWPAAAGIRAIQLYALEPEPARHFLLARTGRTAEGAELAACDGLARELGYLPLALEQAAAYIAAPGAGVDFTRYLRLYREATAELLSRGALGSTEYPDPVITTWQATVAKLSPESRAVLRLCAWYADTPIPRAIVMQGAKDVLALVAAFGPVAPLAGPASAELRMRDALTGLARYSMILDATDTTFRMHGLVQAVERDQALASDDQASAPVALDRLFAMFPDGVFDEPATWSAARQLLPHVVGFGRCAGRAATESKFAEVVEACGRYLHGSGAMAEAEATLRHALGLHEAASGVDSLVTAGCSHNLAHCLLELGKADSAELLLRSALAIYERTIGIEHRNTIVCMHDLAYAFALQGRHREAEEQYRQVLTREECLFGDNHEATLKTVNSLAGCLLVLGKAADALPLCHRALNASECIHGLEHPQTLSCVRVLANCQQALGDAIGALPLYRRALESSERILGAEHPETLQTVHDLAKCREALGDAAGALPLYRRALEGEDRLLGAEHHLTLRSLNDLAGCLRALGDAAGALPLVQRALEAQERAPGTDPYETNISINNLALCTQALGNLAGALPLYRRALESSERVLGPEHPATLVSVGNLAACLDALSQHAEAEALHRRALDGLIGRLGPKHRRVLTSQDNFAVGLRKSGHPDLAEPYARQCAVTTAQVMGEAHPLTLHRRNNLAITLMMLRRTAEVQPLLAANWESPCPHSTPVTSATAFLAALAALLDGEAAADPLGRLKTLLLGPAPPKAPNVATPWDAGYLLDYLSAALPPDTALFLPAALAAINDPAQVPALDSFPLWRNTPALPLDAPWPDDLPARGD